MELFTLQLIQGSGQGQKLQPRNGYKQQREVTKMDEIEAILKNFPKKRPPLDPKIKQIYQIQYKVNRDGKSPASSLAQKLERWMHKKVALCGWLEGQKILEIGGGTLNHIPYEKNFDCYDVVEPMPHLYADSPNLKYVNRMYDDIGDVSKDKRYHRIISIAAFEHIDNLPKVISQCTSLLEPNGRLIVAIPSEGGFLWGLAWRVSTGLEFKIKYNLSYKTLMRYEHINDCFEIKALLQYVFKDIRVEYFGLRNHLSLYQVIDCQQPECKKTLKYF